MTFGLGTCLHFNQHYGFIIALALDTPERYLLVPMCTRRNPHELDVVLNIGDHPTIKHESYIGYYRAQTIIRTQLGVLLNSGRVEHHSVVVGMPLVMRIRAGLMQTNQLGRVQKKTLLDDFAIM